MPRLPKPERCRGCLGDTWQHQIGETKQFTPPHTGFSEGEGAGTNGVLVVGEALGQNEDADGLPFRPYAQAGSLLERAIRRCGYLRSQFRIQNIVRCRPPHDLLADTSYEFEVIQHCRPYLLDELRTMQPRCILALGGTAMRELTGFEGARAGISYTRGFIVPCVIPGFEHVPVIGAFHPSYIKQGNAQDFSTLCNDLKLAVETARAGGAWGEATYEVMERSYSGNDADIPF